MKLPPLPQSGLDRAGHGRSSRLSLNAVRNLAGNIAYYAAVVVITPLAIRALGEERWGIWMLAGAAANCALLLNMGLSSAIAFHVSRAVAAGDSDDLGRSIHAARAYLIGTSIFIVMALVLGGRPLIESLVSAENADLAYRVLLISGIITAATLPSRIFTSALAGLQRFDLLAWFRLTTGLLLVCVVLLGFPAGMDLIGFAIAMTICPALPGILGWAAARTILPADCFRWRKTDFPHMGQMLLYSVNTILYVSGTVLMYQSIKFIASWQLGGAIAAGHVGIAVSLAQTLSVAFVPLAAVIQPRVGDLTATGRSDAVSALLRRSLAATGFIGVPTVVFLELEANTIFNAWVGAAVPPEVVASLSETVRWMLLGQGTYVIFLPCFYVLLGLGEHRTFGIGMIITCATTILLGILATEVRPAISTLGMAFGGTLAVFVLGVTVPAALRRFSLGSARTVWHSIGLPLMLTIPGAVGLQFRPHSEAPMLDLALALGTYGLLSAPGMILCRPRTARARNRLSAR